MDETIEELVMDMPKYIANMQLPDPYLREYYKDEADRVFWIDSDVNDNTLDLVKMIIRCNKEDNGKPVIDRKPIRVMINSGGGDVQVELTIINAIKISKTPVYTINFCNAMSAAADILVSGHKRFALPGTVVMVHSGGYNVGGTVEQANSRQKYVDALIKKANEEFLARTKIKPATLKKKGAFDWYFDEKEALEMGVIDEIITDLEILF
jgi:ATP-dependent Clp protease protease subunit